MYGEPPTKKINNDGLLKLPELIEKVPLQETQELTQEVPLQETQELTQAETQELTQAETQELTQLTQDLFESSQEKNETIQHKRKRLSDIWDVYVIIQGHGEIIVEEGAIKLMNKIEPSNVTLNLLRFAPPGCQNCGQEAARYFIRDQLIGKIASSGKNLLEDKNYLINLFLLGSSVKEDVLKLIEENKTIDFEPYIQHKYSGILPKEQIDVKLNSIRNRLKIINNKLSIKYTRDVTQYAEKKITLSTHPKLLLTGAQVKIYLISRNTKTIRNLDYIMPYIRENRQEVLFSTLVSIAVTEGNKSNEENPYNIHVIDTTCSVFKEGGKSVSTELCSQLQQEISNLFTCEGSEECGIAFGGKRKKSTKKKRITKRRKKRVKITKRRNTNSKRRTTKSKSKRRN